MPLDILNFVRKWQASTLTERSAYQQHFRDLCEALDVPHPTQQDTVGNNYTFEKHIPKTGTDEKGFADVWKRGYFAWEYKSKGGDLKAAYRQINQYHEALENPPLLIVCDFDHFEVHTKFENLPTRVYSFTLEDLLHPERDTPTSAIPPLEVLRHAFDDYNQLRPNRTSARVTEAAAADFLRLAQQIELERAAHPLPYTKEQIAHFLMRLVFCLFADSVKLIPNHAFRRLIENHRHSPIGFNKILPSLFEAMSNEGGFFGADNIPYFNGGLFTDNTAIPLNHADLGILYSAAQHDWSHIEPSIFGTLFERSLDAAKRSLIGAHYTSPDDILLLVEPVVMQPLYRRWAEVQKTILAALAEEEPSSTQPPSSQLPSAQLPSARPDVPQSTEISANGATTYQPGVKPQVRTQQKLQRAEGPTQKANLAPNSQPSPKQFAASEPPNLLDDDATSANGATTYQPGPQAQVGQQEKTEGLKARHKTPANIAPKSQPSPKRSAQSALRLNRPALELLQNWAAELSSIRVLDPACGSGNFLYITLKRLLDLWHEARIFGIHHGLTIAVDPMPSPAQLFGIETDFYAHEIASVVVWIGFLQWKHDHGVEDHKTPLLQKLTNIEHGDAIMRYDETGKPYEPEWPEVEYIVGNPPFLGGSKLRHELKDKYIDDLYALFDDRVAPQADLVTYWFEKARREIEHRGDIRAGLIATQAIRGGVNRRVLDRICESGAIFAAWSDRPWSLEGAAVHVSLIAFDNGDQKERVLDGGPVEVINTDLTAIADTTKALRLTENNAICYRASEKGGPFDIEPETARKFLSMPINPNGKSNSEVLRPWLNAVDITGRPRNLWIIDFGDMAQHEAALFEAPYSYLRSAIELQQADATSKKKKIVPREKWWLHRRPGSEMREAVKNLSRYAATIATGKHRLFTWLDHSVLPDHQLYIFAREDDYFFGILHSKIHEVWALQMGTALEDRPRYTPTTTFDTFPFPWPPGKEPKDDPRVEAIASAARELVAKRDAWLNPPDISEADLKKRTLTNLYNERQAGRMIWLANLHRTLDEAVFNAYGWPSNISDSEILSRLLALNHERAATNPKTR